MRIGTEKEFIELTELDRNPSGTPCAGDIQINVSVKLQEFGGRYSEVWLEFSAMKCFLTQIEALEEFRQGSAKISSMSPEEFSFEIRSSDKLGHMEIEVSLQRYQHSGPKYWPTEISGGFQIDSQAIKQLILCFRRFTN
jgi:hypothetical protein